MFGTSAAGSFKGVMDELALYTTALTANVVTSHNQTGRLQLAARHLAHDAPLAWWRLGEPSGVTAIDATGNGYNAIGAVFTLLTPDRDATGLLAGDPDRATKFNGTSDHFTTSSPTGPPITNSSFSIEAWVKPDSGTTAKDMAIYGQHASATAGNSLSLRISNGKVRFSFGGTNFDTTSSPITYGTTNHVGVTYDQPTDTARIYVNGTLVQTKTAMGGPFLPATPPAANIGAHYFSSSTQQPFQGIIDDVAVYNRVLDATAIGEHHAGASSPPSPGFFDWIYENYDYDGDGRRVRTDTPFTAPLLTRTYDIDTTLPHGQLAVERDGLGNVIASYTYGSYRISQITETGTAYFHPDALGSTMGMTNADGTLAYRQTYEPYGTTQFNDPTTGTSAFQYTGEHHDTTGLYHLRARQYAPGTGRFTATDPLDRSVGESYTSAFAYTDGQPILLVDPQGTRGIRRQPAEAFVAPPTLAPPILPLPRIPPTGAPSPNLIRACAASLVCAAGAIGVTAGVAIYLLDPFNYTDPVENFGGALVDTSLGEAIADTAVGECGFRRKEELRWPSRDVDLSQYRSCEGQASVESGGVSV